MKKKRTHKTYSLHCSPLYRIGTKRKLRKQLNIPKDISLESLVSDEMYNVWEDEVKGKLREFAAPKRTLGAVHKKIFTLLQRIETPSCLHSGKKGYSAISNAKQHIGNTHLVKLDIRKFYPSSSRQYVYLFFKKQMQCSNDVSDILSRIVTCKGVIPTGSSVSQLMIYFAYKPMFDEIESYVDKLGGKMTCYVDDITLSGNRLSNIQLWELNKIIRKHGLSAHKFNRYNPKDAKLVTGVVVRGDKALVRNSTLKKIYDIRKQLENETDPSARGRLESKLRGHLNYAGQIEPKFKKYASTLSTKKK